MPIVHPGRRGFYPVELLLLAAFLFLCPGRNPLQAAGLADPAVDAYNLRIGTETFAAMYQFSTNTALVETAQAITNMGSDTIKLYLASNTSGQEGVSLSSKITNLITLARDCPSYHQVFDMPFRHFIVWAYPFANSDEWWGSGYNTAAGAKDYREMYDVTRYFLTNYNNSGKTFYLGHWEGDGYLRVNNWTTNPPAATIQGMIGWLNNRQQAVDDAKRDTAYTNVSVFNYAECNRVRDAMNNGPGNNQRVVNYVLPYVTNLDYLSYSSYDAQNLSTADLYSTLNYMQSMLPTNKADVVPGERMWIGEYGWGAKSTAAQEPLIRAYIQRLLGWNHAGQSLPFILYWEMYSNFNSGGGTNYCLIDYLDRKVPAWYLENYFFNAAHLLVAQFKETNGRLPSDTEFVSLVSPLLNQPLAAPTPLTVNNSAGVLVSNLSATVSGTLTQGIYGADEARAWVFYGRQDGGVNSNAWEKAVFVGVNTNFNPVTFTATLSELASNTDYFFRFYTANASNSVWAPVSGQFSTAIMNPSDYGSRMKVTFSGYHRAETLSNFPMLLDLGTNLPGFSYRQFASPTGGDLRFADANGILIPHEMDEWNTSGTSSVWVNVPSLSGSNDFIWAYWGNPTATNPPAYTTNGAVWSNDNLVWHLKENSFPYADSAQQSPALSGVAPVLTNGVIGHGEWFNGSLQFLNAGVMNLGSAFTLSAWVRLDPSATNIQTIWANKPGGWNAPGFALYANTYNTADGKLILETGDGVNGNNASTVAGVMTTGQWHYVVAAVDKANGAAQLYVDGTNDTSVAKIDAALPDVNPVNVGRFTNSTLYLKGTVDEARIQPGLQSSNSVWASWMTVASNSTLQNESTVTQQLPVLHIGLNTDSGASLNWPASGVGFTLYTTTSLVPPVAWVPVPGQPVLTNNQWQMTLPPGSNTVFYCLQSL